MNDSHDPIRHLKYLRQSLSQDNESIGFFISAGCPLSVNMPEKNQWPLIPDVANLTKYINEQLKEDEKYKTLLIELKKAEKNIENIEDILSFLRSLLLVSKGGEVRGLSETDLKGLEQKISTEIVKKLNVSLPDQETPYHHLCNWIRSIDRKIAVELFTTNYDLLMEQALEGLIYEIKVIPTTTSLMIDGKEKRLEPGMNVTTEIKVGKRRIIEFFIYPIIQYMDEGLSVR
ncbi:hypothetical protein [Sulfurospirillum cavolei]|uniref:hypothetical protein n=1 Tax=Sulfurospirillum cavolei TaxID=366522 RepID=UPI0009DE77CB|nr:hypothetical protein [Sulfurospirillum cavolei]